MDYKKISKEIKDLNYLLAERQMKLENYFNSQFSTGITEFRINFITKDDFYIHPLNKDGETLDGSFSLKEK